MITSHERQPTEESPNEAQPVSACETHLLSDEPASSDALGAHDRIAELLAEIVKSEEGGRAVALIGNYGAGKSTIVQLLNNKLRSSGSEVQKFEVFLFDAWAHQGDPLRRSFLEEFRDFLVRRHWIGREILRDEINKLRQRFSESESQSTPVFTLAGALVLLSFFFIPLGSEIRTDHPWLGALFMFLPVATTLVAWLLDRPNGKFWERAFYTRSRSGSEGTAVFELLWKKTHEVTRSKSVSAPDPTSVEFRKLFRELADKALHDEQRKLVIVMDNLDRLDPDDAMQIFATMRTFFDQSHDQEPWDRRLWLVVPFDSLWIIRLMKAEIGLNDVDDKSAASSEFQPSNTVRVVDGSAVAIRATSFLDKSFQIKLRITEPVLSSWKTYLIGLLRRSCPRHSEDFDGVYLLYDELAGGSSHKLAPRAFKQFANRVATLHLEWHDAIPFKTIAAYALLEDRLDLNAIAKSKSLLDQRAESVLADADWRKNFAALYLNVDPEHATEVLIGDDVRKAISDGDVDALRRFLDLRGLPTVYEKIVSEDSLAWAKQSPATLAAAAFVLSELNISSLIAKERIRLASESVEKWSLSGPKEGEGIVCILKTYAPSAQMQELSRILTHIAPPSDDTIKVAAEDLQKWIETLFVMLKWAEEVDKKSLAKLVAINSSPIAYLRLLAAARKLEHADRRLIRYLQPAADRTEIVDALLSLSTSDPTATIDALNALMQVQGDWPLDRMADVIHKELHDTSQLDEKRLFILIRMLLRLATYSRDMKARQLLKDLAASGFILHHISYAPQSNQTMPYLLIAYLIYGPQSAAAGQSGQGQAQLDDIVARPSDQPFATILSRAAELYPIYGDPIEDLVRWSSQPQFDRLAGTLLALLLKQKGLELPWVPEVLARNYDYVKKILPPDVFESLNAAVVANDKFETAVAAGQLLLERSQLYRSMLVAEDETVRGRFIQWLKSGLSSFDSAAWSAELQAGKPSLDLIRDIVAAGEREWVESDELRDGLYAHAESIADGKSAPPRSTEEWALIVGALQHHHQEVLLRDVLDVVLSNRANVLKVLELFRQPFLQHDILREKADDVVRHIFRRLLDANEEWALPWLRMSMDRHPSILTNAQASSVRYFAEQVHGLLSDPNLEEKRRAELTLIGHQLTEAGYAVEEPKTEQEPEGSESRPHESS